MTARKRHPTAPPPEAFDAALTDRAAEWRDDIGVRYLRVREDYHGIPRGVLRVDGRVVPDYPHIPRVFSLAAGLRENLPGPFRVEEKIDGYNVRLFRARGRLLAVTRSGCACPFTIDRLPDLLDVRELHALFDEQPELVVCAEVAGPGNPYMDSISPRGGGDVRLFVFDLMRCGRERFESLDRRDALLAHHGLPVAPVLGRFTAAELPGLLTLLRRLDAEGAEGIVLKAEADDVRLKYVAPSINVSDAASEAALELELPGEFYVHRMVRMVMALRELDERERVDELGAAFGRALAVGFDRTLDQVEGSGRLTKTYTVRLREAASVDALLAHLNRGSRTVSAEEVDREWDGRHWRLTFRKVFRRSTSKLETLLGGQAVFD